MLFSHRQIGQALDSSSAWADQRPRHSKRHFLQMTTLADQAGGTQALASKRASFAILKKRTLANNNCDVNNETRY